MTDDDPSKNELPTEAQPAENPYASSRVPLPPVQRPVSILGMLGIAVVTLLSSSVAFCCTCFPIGMASLSYSFRASDPARARVGELLGMAAFGGGLLVGVIVGYFVATRLWRRWQRQ